MRNFTNNIIESHHLEKTLFKSLLVVFVLLSVTYIYFISSITFNVLARKSLDNSVRSLENDISEKELTYMNSLNKIDKSFALSKGFVEVNNSIFAERVTTRVAIR